MTQLLWSPWSPCSKSCGGGVQARINSEAQREERRCSTQACPQPLWSPWGPCSKTCGGGIKTRTNGRRTERRLCNTSQCESRSNNLFFQFASLDQVHFIENINISISAAILITGGYGAEQSAEVFLPWSNTTCQLPSLPDRRYRHVQSSQLLCGGGDYDSSTRRSCLNWNKQTGGWVKLPLSLSEERLYSSIWDRGDQLIIMGGDSWSDAAGWSSEIVSSDGAVTSRSFRMKYKTR